MIVPHYPMSREERAEYVPWRRSAFRPRIDMDAHSWGDDTLTVERRAWHRADAMRARWAP